VIGARVVRLASVASTNDTAASLAAAGEPEGTVVVADTQEAGRGRQGRPWHSPAGESIYASLILRPARPLREWPDLSWVLAAGVAGFAREAGAAAAAVKYPNDVLVAGRKLAGLLLETRTGVSDAAALIAGVGINVNSRDEDFPPGLRQTATSLYILTGRRGDCGALLGTLCAHLDYWYSLWCREGAAGARRFMVDSGLDAGGSGAHPGSIEAAAFVAATVR